MTQAETISQPVATKAPSIKIEGFEDRHRRFISTASLSSLVVTAFLSLVIIPYLAILNSPALLTLSVLAPFIIVVSIITWQLALRGKSGLAAIILYLAINLAFVINYFGGETAILDLLFTPIAAMLGLVVLNYRAAIATLIIAVILATYGLLSDGLVYTNSVPVTKASLVETLIILAFQFLTIGLAIYLAQNLHTANVMFSLQAVELNEGISEREQRREIGEKVSHEIAGISAQIQATANEQNISSQEQAAAIAEVAAFVQQMSNTAQTIATRTAQLSQEVQEINSSTTRVKDTATKVVEAGEIGALAVEKAIVSSQKVTELYQNLQSILQDLKQQQGQIKEVVNIIRNISDETKLLSLNAAIEAAGAGEFGERFGVVASEVKALANRSLTASKEVNNILSYVEGRIQQAATAAETAFAETKVTVSATEDSGMAMRDLSVTMYHNSHEIERIESAIKVMTDQTKEISQATNQQSHASSQVAITLQEINHLADQNTNSSQEVSHIARNLEILSDELVTTLTAKTSTDGFKPYFDKT